MAAATESDTPFYLRGAHAPVKDEVEAFDLPVRGALPPELDGHFLRNGPNPPAGDPGHWFLGDGMLHGVELRDGQVLSYRNRYVQTLALHGAKWLDPDKGFDFTAGVANTHVIEHAGRILTLAENALPWEVNRDLETLGCYDFAGRLDSPMTAHPKICPVTGELHFFGYHVAPPFLTYHRANAAGELVESRPIEIPRPIMAHDFAITDSFVIFMDLPIVFSAESAARGGIPFLWNEDAGARLGFMRRDVENAPVDWIEIDPCYVFHPANAFSDGNQVTLDVARYETLWQGRSDSFDIAKLHRFEVDLDSQNVRETPLDDRGIEFPRINDTRTGLTNRFAYAVWNRDEAGEPGNGLVRYDLVNGTRSVFDSGLDWIPSEAVFVPSADDASEGDGWLLCYGFDAARNESELAVFDATSIEGGPIAQATLPQRVPVGFHGSWIPRNDAT